MFFPEFIFFFVVKLKSLNQLAFRRTCESPGFRAAKDELSLFVYRSRAGNDDILNLRKWFRFDIRNKVRNFPFRKYPCRLFIGALLLKLLRRFFDQSEKV